MSSFSPMLWGRLGILAFLAAAVAGCNIQPLHGTNAGTQNTAALLAQVDITPAKSRVEQVLRNELEFRMNGGQSGAGTYVLSLATDSTASSVLVRTVSGKPQARFVTVEATYRLTKAGSDTILDTGTLKREASFDWSDQRFANSRAGIDAENRAAKALADDIYALLSGYFASNR